MMKLWVFWLQLGIILVLASFIIIRDKNVKNFFKNIFSWAKKKIRIAKIKSKINNLIDNKNTLIPRLAEIFWGLGIKDSIGSEIIKELDFIDNKNKNLLKTLNITETHITEIKKDKEKNLTEKNNEINAIKNENSPIEIELKKLEKIFDSTDKTIRDNKKLIQKIENNININNKEKNKIINDPPGYKTENEKTLIMTKLDKKNKSLQGELDSITKKNNELRAKNPSSKNKLDELRAKNSSFNLQLNSLKENILTIKKQYSDENNRLELKKKGLESELKDIIKEKNIQLKNLGYKLIERRTEHTATKDIYSQIDNIAKSIIILKKKLIKIDKSDIPK